MSIIESIKDYLAACPYLSGKEININYLSPNPDSFAIDNVAKNPIVKRYVSGETIRQYCFLLAGRVVYDGDLNSNIEISQFFESFENWISAQNEAGVFPDLADNDITPIAIEVTKSGEIQDTARTSARIQFELRLLYKRNN
ncbi:MAG: chloramphenicol resistance protein [Firmicutes bacterium]|nr:chloramphenicol resistance protein [Bacillota bacterium]